MRRDLKVVAGAGALMVLLFSVGPAQALSGTNTVTSDDIIDGQVKTTDLGLSAVTSARVKDNSLTGADINEATLHPRLEFMVVRANGNKVSGTGTSVRNGVGQYGITFSHSVADCAATVSPGDVPGGGTTAVTIAMVSNFGGNVYGVVMKKFDGSATFDTDFRMTLICP